MHLRWLIKNQSQKLIIFFNGWGLDDNPFCHMESQNYDVLIFQDYRNLSLPDSFLAITAPYASVSLIAYSMGVWSAHRLLADYSFSPTFSLAINGTLNPIHDRFGIPSSVYDEQINNFDRNQIQHFYRRMFSREDDYQRFIDYCPKRAWQDQLEELICLKQTINQAPMDLTAGQYDAAIISRQDKIMASRHQLRFWKNQCDLHMIDAGHFPFFRWSSWEALMNEVQGE